MSVAWDIMNIFPNYADIQFQTEIELKVLEQIQTVQPFMYKPTCKNSIQASKLTRELLFKHCSCYSALGVSQPSPLTEISSRDLERVAALIEIVNKNTTPHYNRTKSRWRERRMSSLSQVASSSEWLLHCILKNLIVLRIVTRSF
jgi:hypothetical protein